MKKLLVNILRKFFELCARNYFRRNHPKVVVISGSIGKTSTKEAAGVVLAERWRVRKSRGNENSMLGVPFGIVGVEYPGSRRIKNPLVAMKISWQFVKKSFSRDGTEIIVQELGTDSPGEIPHFGKYIKADFAIVTAITPEHMEGFKTIGAIAVEELSVKDYSDHLIINTDDTPKKYLKDLKFTPYVAKSVEAPKLLGRHSQIPVRGAVTLAKLLGMTDEEIARGVKKIEPTKGRMRLFDGINNTKLIDDTYNSS
ncbi:Mur ligase family protein, partial [Candidatus Saccharibacteria bacterium]|nr:Mur ligase family protein [Candidatus Saccharibacteria bacterium]